MKLIKLFIFLTFLYCGAALVASPLKEENKVPEKSRPFTMIPGEIFLNLPLGYVAGHGVPVTLTIEEDDDITKMADIRSLKCNSDTRALSSLDKRGLYKRSFEGKNINIGDYIELPSQKIEIVESPNLPSNSKGYTLLGYTDTENVGNKENLAYRLEIIGGYKKDITDIEFISGSEISGKCVYVVQYLCTHGNEVISSASIYRYFSGLGIPADNMWYYENNGRKLKIEKTFNSIKNTDGVSLYKVFNKRIFGDNYVEEYSFAKYRESQNSSGRIVKNGRIRRGDGLSAGDNASIKTIQFGSSKSKLGASGEKSYLKSENSTLYLTTSKGSEYLRGKIRSKHNSDGSWTVFEYHPTKEGDLRSFTTPAGVALTDISGDGEIGIEDLNNTSVEIETLVLTDWQGARHTKSIRKTMGIASYSNEKLENGYNVVTSGERDVSLKYYDHIRTDKGGLIERISYSKTDANSDLSVYKIEELSFAGLAMDIPTSGADITVGENGNSKVITVPDQYVRLNDSGFVVVNGSPDYSKAPILNSNIGSFRNAIFSVYGVESQENTTLTLPWGGTYVANNFSPVSGKTTLNVRVDLNATDKPLYEAAYVYISGTFYLTEWTYYKYDTSLYPYDLRGTYRYDNTYSTQSALVNNIRTVIDFDGCEYQICYGGDNNDKEIWRRKKGINSAEYGNQNDFIILYSDSVSNLNGAVVSDNSGPYAVSYFSSNISESGAPKATDELLYQTYIYKDNVYGYDYNAVEVDKFGIVTRIQGSESTDSDYILKTIKPGFNESQAYSVLANYNQNGFKYKLSGAGVVSVFYRDYNFEDQSYDSVIGSENSGRIDIVEKNEDGELLRTENAFGSVNYTYNESGELKEIQYPDGKTIENIYDAFGTKIKTATKYFNPETNLDTEVEPPSTYARSYLIEDGDLWNLYSESVDGEIVNTKMRLSGFSVAGENGGVPIEEIYSESDKEKIVQKTFLDRAAKEKVVEKYRYVKDGDNYTLRGKIEEKYLNGRYVEAKVTTYTTAQSVLTEHLILFSYDDADRITEKKYYAGNTHLFDQKYFYLPSENVVFKDESNNNKTIKSLGYEHSTSIGKDGNYMGRMVEFFDRDEKHAGLLKSQAVAVSFDTSGKPISGRWTHADYNDLGKVTRVWGCDEIPMLCDYNEFGELSDMYLFKSSPENASAFVGSSWPAAYTSSHPDAERTHWSFDEATGLVTSKTDALNKTISASYNNFGDLETLTNPDGSILNFTYDFARRRIGESSQGVSYSYSYNSDNKVSQIVSGTDTYSLEYGSHSDFPVREVFPDGVVLTREIDPNGNITKVKLQKNSDTLYEVQYSYNENNRLSSISALGKTITYSMNSNSEITGINLNNSASISYTYDTLQRIKTAAYTANNVDLSKNTYNYVEEGKMGSVYVKKSGVDYGNWQYTYYDDKPGVESAKFYKAAQQVELFDAYSKESFDYDIAGNPISKIYNSPSDSATLFTANANNQTVQINRPSDLVYPIRGATNESASVNISLNDVPQQYEKPAGESEYMFVIEVFSSIWRYIKVKIESILSALGFDGADAKTMAIGAICLPVQQETLTYDDNGNLSSDARWNYSWDSKNRLIAMETCPEAIASGVVAERYVFKYDYADRKVRSDYYTKGASDAEFTLRSTNKRYYDNWNLIYETTEYATSGENARPADVKKYYYGVDLLSGLYNSGGTGGLRMLEINGVPAYVFCNSTGNVEALYSAEPGEGSRMLAHYEYSPFGKVLRQSGELAAANPLRFSTRYYESTTGLYYYGYRHYSPVLMKWINKDPIAEQGGVNLYAFCANNSIVFWDNFGLCNGINHIKLGDDILLSFWAEFLYKQLKDLYSWEFGVTCENDNVEIFGSSGGNSEGSWNAKIGASKDNGSSRNTIEGTYEYLPKRNEHTFKIQFKRKF